MSLAQKITRAMNRIAPLSLAEKWDNVGLLLEAPKPRPNAHNVLLTIDLTSSVLKEALASSDNGAIISYHPPIFRPLSSLTLANSLQSSLLQCAAEGISIYSPHTSLDCAEGGVSDWLASGVLSDDQGSVTVLGDEKDGKPMGPARLVTLSNNSNGLDIESLSQRIKSFLKLEQIQVASPPEGNRTIRSVALCAGSGGSALGGVDADAYFTGEMSHHEVLAMIASGKHVILCGHTNTERGFLPVLAKRLELELRKEDVGPYSVSVSVADAHPLRFV